MVSQQRHVLAMDRINALLETRERCCSEIRTRLTGDGFTEEEVQDALDAAVRCGLLSDERYTRAYIRGKVALRWGRLKIIARLQHNGISEDLINICSDEFLQGQDEYEQASQEVRRRSTHSSNPRASLVRRLVSKGFSYDLAVRVVDDFLSGRT